MKNQAEEITMQTQLKWSKNKVALFVGALALMSSSVALAGPVTLTNTFTTGTAATAASVNQNFTDVKTAVDGNATDIGVNATAIGNNQTNIGSNTTAIGTNQTNIGTNQTDIGTNATAIGTNQTDIGTNVTAIGTNQTDIGANTTAIGTNQTNIGTNTTNIGNNGGRITALENAGSGGGTGGGSPFATAVAIDCTVAGGQTTTDIQNAIDDTTKPLGRLVITVSGTCSGNLNLIITRDDVTLIGDTSTAGTPGIIQGLVTTPPTATVAAAGRRGLVIQDISVLGGQAAVLLDGSEAKIISSTIGSNSTNTATSTQSSGLVALNSQVEFIGGTQGNTIIGGITAQESDGLFLGFASNIQFSSGNNTIQAGNASQGIVIDIGSTLLSGDLVTAPTSFNVTGNIEVNENSTLVLVQAAVTGDIDVRSNSTATLQAEVSNTVSVSGTLFVHNTSSALLESFGSLSVANLNIGSIGSVNVQGNASITSNVTMDSFASLFFNVTTTGADIPGILTCNDFNSRVGTNSGTLANTLKNGNVTAVAGDIVCGYTVP